MKLGLDPKDFLHGKFYSFDPVYLKRSLDVSRGKLNLSTIDCVLLQNPFEVGSIMYPDPAEYTKRLAKAFEFYEEQV